MGTTVLVIEDEFFLADDLTRSLCSAGAEVVGPVGTLAEAEDSVRRGGFDCAVIDMNLRGDFAYGLAQKLREAHVPLVLATGYNQNSLPDALAGVPRVEKPFSPREVIDLLASLVSPASS